MTTMTIQDLYVTAVNRAAFTREWAAWRREHERALTDPHGFLAITSLHWLREDGQRFDDVPGEWKSDAAGVTVALVDGESLTVDGEPIRGEHRFGVIPERASLTAAFGNVLVEIAKRGGHDILRPRDPQSALLSEHLRAPAYPPDPDWARSGRFIAFDAPRQITVGAAVEGLRHVYDSPGQVEFTLDDRVFRLTAFNGKSPQSLTVIFTDLTSGNTTYSANRVLHIPAPDEYGELVVDFNRACNLPCAYTDLATCPLPPAENHLPIAVEAGEKTPYERT